MCIVVRPTNNPHAEPTDERQRYEQRLMRIGRKLQSTGQLLEQAPARIVGKGFPVNPEITGERPVQIELDELRDFFDSKVGNNIGQLLHEYHELLSRLKRDAAR
ncbi:MAG: hypothetical protein ACRDF9_09425 [Candidatus Limnocylindria bacterium]